MTEAEAKLVRMAREIRQFFRRQGEDAAAAATAVHIRQFWAPAMRRDFLDLAAREAEALPDDLRRIAAALEAPPPA